MERFGAFVFSSRYGGQSDGAVLARAVAAARTAEASGFDEVWCTEHHFISYGVIPSAATFAAYVLGATSRIGVGTAVTILPTHAPVAVAEQAALLDHLSGGRFLLGVGRGGPVVDYEALGRSLEHWADGLPEAVDILLASWRGEVAADTDRYRFRTVHPQPRPLTQPHPPLFVAAVSDAGMELAARHGLPMLFFFHQDDATKAALVARHAELAAAHGHPQRDYGHAFAVVAQVNDSPSEVEHVVREVAVPFLERARHEYVMLAERPSATDGLDATTFVDFFAGHVLASHPVGPPEVCAERLVESLRASGCSRVLMQVEATGNLLDTVTNVERLGREVLPVVRDRLTPVASAG